MPFLLTSIKELKGEEMKFLITPEFDSVISGFKVPKTNNDSLDFTKLTNEQYIAFRYAFVEMRMFNPTYQANKGSRAMDLILSVLCMVICNRVPKGVVSFRTDNLTSKIKMVHAPRGVEPFTRTDIAKGSAEPVTVEKNTNEKAIVRILVPKRAMTLSEINAENEKLKQEEADENEDEENKGEQSPDKAKEAGRDSKLSAAEGKSSQVAGSRLSNVPSERIIEQD